MNNYKEQYRPQFHFSPEYGWMNDPNGLIFHNQEYHLFYQFYPDDTVWGPMHWGHAISSDLLHWKPMPIALYPDLSGMIFSGCTVMDLENLSGFGIANNPAMVAIFTYHNNELEKKGSDSFQNQAIAYSTDNGRTWVKYGNNPVLKNPGIRDFRDPKVFWHNQSNKWIMILAVRDRVHIYSSQDLINWNFESEFGNEIGAHDGIWECPDLFPLIVENTGDTKWVMLVSVNNGGPNGGSATQYFVGEFDGKKYTCKFDKCQWVDWGRDNYAGITWSNIPVSDGRRLYLGWMSNWQYASVIPTYHWRGAMTIPREFTLRNTKNTYLLISQPAKELKKLRCRNPLIVHSQKIFGNYHILTDKININQCEMIFNFMIEKSITLSNFGIILCNDLQEKLTVCYSYREKQITVDRNLSGSPIFSKEFPGIITAQYHANSQLQFNLFVDASSMELFVNYGELVITSLIFPTEQFNKLLIFSVDGYATLKKAEIYNLERIW